MPMVLLKAVDGTDGGCSTPSPVGGYRTQVRERFDTSAKFSTNLRDENQGCESGFAAQDSDLLVAAKQYRVKLDRMYYKLS